MVHPVSLVKRLIGKDLLQVRLKFQLDGTFPTVLRTRVWIDSE